MLDSPTDHAGNVILWEHQYTLTLSGADVPYQCESMLTDEAEAIHALHQSRGGIWVVGGDHAHIAPRLLHDHAEDEPTVDAMLSGAVVDCGLDVRDVGVCVRSRRQGWEID